MPADATLPLPSAGVAVVARAAGAIKENRVVNVHAPDATATTAAPPSLVAHGMTDSISRHAGTITYKEKVEEGHRTKDSKRRTDTAPADPSGRAKDAASMQMIALAVNGAALIASSARSEDLVGAATWSVASRTVNRPDR